MENKTEKENRSRIERMLALQEVLNFQIVPYIAEPDYENSPCFKEKMRIGEEIMRTVPMPKRPDQKSTSEPKT